MLKQDRQTHGDAESTECILKILIFCLGREVLMEAKSHPGSNETIPAPKNDSSFSWRKYISLVSQTNYISLISIQLKINLLAVSLNKRKATKSIKMWEITRLSMWASKPRILFVRYFHFIMLLSKHLVVTLSHKLTSPVLGIPLQGSAMQYYKKA